MKITKQRYFVFLIIPEYKTEGCEFKIQGLVNVDPTLETSLNILKCGQCVLKYKPYQIVSLIPAADKVKKRIVVESNINLLAKRKINTSSDMRSKK